MNNKNKLSTASYFLLLISGVICVASLLSTKVFWTPMLLASIATVCCLFLGTFWLHLKLVDYYALAILSIGGIVAASVAMNNESVLTASIVLLGIALVGVIMNQGSDALSSDEGSVSAKLDVILEAAQMSENAKRILFRDRELQLLRQTVQDDISKGAFHSALILCEQMSNIFGAVEEAEQMRTQVQQIIHNQHENRIREEMEQLHELLNKHKWVEAYQFSARLRRLFPESPLLHGIEQTIADARTEYGHELEDRFLQAAQSDNVEQAMALLRELDRYLTPEEARRFRDTATTVITTYRENLGARFKMAVNDHRWQDAIDFGQEITRQFPNTKMAEEVNEILETIKVRAAEDETTS